jgi:hypothetical protein
VANASSKKKIWHVIVSDTRGTVEPMVTGPVQKGDQIWFHPADTELEVDIFFPFNTPFTGKRFSKGKKTSVKQEVVADVASQTIFGYGTPNLALVETTGPEIIVDPGGDHRPGAKGKVGKKKAGKKR